MHSRTHESAGAPAQYSLSVVGDPPILQMVVVGRFVLGSWLEAISRVPATPGFRPGLDSLVDARRAHFDLSGEDIRLLAFSMRQHVGRRGGGGFRSAHVVSDDLSFGLSRMLKACAKDELFELAVFRSIDEAKSWLGDGPLFRRDHAVSM